VSEIEDVQVVHVPVPEGVCVVVPATDLNDRASFALWSRAYFKDGIFTNPEWRACGARLFEEELSACANGSAEAAAKLLAMVPQALEYEQVRAVLHHLAWTYDRAGFKFLMDAITRARPIHVKPLTPAAKAAAGIVAKGLGSLLFQPSSGRPPSIEAIIDAAGREHAVNEDIIRRRLGSFVRRFKAAYPRYVSNSFPCGSHGAAMWWTECEVSRAPRLILKAPSGRRGRRTAVEGTPVAPVEIMLGAADRFGMLNLPSTDVPSRRRAPARTSAPASTRRRKARRRPGG
jgi:hypothetical protein